MVGKEDDEHLIKPLAFVVLKPDRTPSKQLAEELQQHVKSRLAMYKYPRWIEFIGELPKTATGKIQRFKLRAMASEISSKSVSVRSVGIAGVMPTENTGGDESAPQRHGTSWKRLFTFSRERT